MILLASSGVSEGSTGSWPSLILMVLAEAVEDGEFGVEKTRCSGEIL